MPRHVIVERLFAERYVLNRDGFFAAHEFFETIDPEPTHRLLAGFRLDVSAKVANRQNIAKILDPRVGFEAAQIGPRHAILEFSQSRFGYLAVLDERGVC